MRQHHNVLYVTTVKAQLHQCDAAVEVRRIGHPPARLPRHHLQAIVCFGEAWVSPRLMATCAQEGISLTFLSPYGRFLARVVGPQQGNVLLRRAQYARSDDGLELARCMVGGKLANCRTLVRRWAREAQGDSGAEALGRTADQLTESLAQAQNATSLDQLRGVEGSAAVAYFSAFRHSLRGDPCFAWSGRNRRPPRDPANAVLSFLYALLAVDCRGAAEAIGLDPQVGFLHAIRPGRPALALDLMEELRPVLGDRTLVRVVNRGQLRQRHFVQAPSGAVNLSDEGRRIVLTNYQGRKREELRHPFLREQTSYAIMPHLQARLLARHLRGDLDAYPPFLMS